MPDAIVLLRDERIPPARLRELVKAYFGEMVKDVVIRPRAGNRGMEIQDSALRQRVSELTDRLLLGREDELP